MHLNSYYYYFLIVTNKLYSRASLLDAEMKPFESTSSQWNEMSGRPLVPHSLKKVCSTHGHFQLLSRGKCRGGQGCGTGDHWGARIPSSMSIWENLI